VFIFISCPDVDDLKQELVKCELHNEELLTELKARERDILMEKREAEKVNHDSDLK
jgi:guanylate kinase